MAADPINYVIDKPSWACVVCGCNQASGKSVRMVTNEADGVDIALCSTCDNTDTLARALVEGRDGYLAMDRTLDHAGVPRGRMGAEIMYKIEERVAILARWLSGAKGKR